MLVRLRDGTKMNKRHGMNKGTPVAVLVMGFAVPVSSAVAQQMGFFPVRVAPFDSLPGTPGSPVAVQFNDDLDCWELPVLSGGAEVHFDQCAPTIEVGSANDPASIELLRGARLDVVVVFGTGRLGPPVIEVCPEGMVNLHGGDPEAYRGLDSHLWAIHDGAFESLVTTLHRVNARLDDGEVISQRGVRLTRGMRLHELRSRNTEVCVDLVRETLRTFRDRGGLRSRPQSRRGLYYSFMPAALKERCRTQFERYTEALV